MNHASEFCTEEQKEGIMDKMVYGKSLSIFISATLIFLMSCFSVQGSEILLDDYQKGLSPKWEEKSFQGKTRYEVAREDGHQCIRATSQAAASGLFYEIRYDPKAYPILKWRWKADHILRKGDALKKAGDDYVARVYVVFPSLAFWKTRAINYIWANKLPKGKAVPNPFTANAIMVAVESGPSLTGQWVEEARNIFEDYRKYFGEDPPEVGAVAIMTDTDNTGEVAVAWYGEIRALSAPNAGDSLLIYEHRCQN